MEDGKCFKDYLQELVSLMETNNFYLQQLLLMNAQINMPVVDIMGDPEVDPNMKKDTI